MWGIILEKLENCKDGGIVRVETHTKAAKEGTMTDLVVITLPKVKLYGTISSEDPHVFEAPGLVFKDTLPTVDFSTMTAITRDITVTKTNWLFLNGTLYHCYLLDDGYNHVEHDAIIKYFKGCGWSVQYR